MIDVRKVEIRMQYEELYRESNELAEERLELVMERIAEIAKATDVPAEYDAYFRKTADYLLLLAEMLQKKEEGRLAARTMEECQADNDRLFCDVTVENYATSFANPTYAVQTLGSEYGQILSMLYVAIRQVVGDVFAGKKMNLTIHAELFVEIYNHFESEEGIDKHAVEQSIYWFFHDYTELFVEEQVSKIVDPREDFLKGIVMESDLNDLRYLYQYGQYIGENELGVAAFLNTLSEEEIQAMADTYTEGYRIGFINTGKDLSKKLSAQLRYPIGFERMARVAVGNFKR